MYFLKLSPESCVQDAEGTCARSPTSRQKINDVSLSMLFVVLKGLRKQTSCVVGQKVQYQDQALDDTRSFVQKPTLLERASRNTQKQWQSLVQGKTVQPQSDSAASTTGFVHPPHHNHTPISVLQFLCRRVPVTKSCAI